MNDLRLGEIESRFAEIIWKNEPLSSAGLALFAEKELGWKKTTSYTVLKRLCAKGIFQNSNGQVTSLIKKDKYYSLKSERFVDESFGGSLPAFLTAFTNGKPLSQEEIKEIKKIISEYEEV
jgi:predicted transcriptional regulator